MSVRETSVFRWSLLLVSGAIILAAPLTIVACAATDGEDESGEERNEVIARIIDNTTAEQERFLRDGEVTEADYEAAVLAAVQCMEEAGYETSTAEHGHVIRIQGEGVASLEEVDRWQAAYDDCADTYLRDVEQVWQLQHAPSEQEQQEREAAYLACVQDHGIEAGDLAVLMDLQAEGRISERDQVALNLCSVRHMGGSEQAAEMLEDRLAGFDE